MAHSLPQNQRSYPNSQNPLAHPCPVFVCWNKRTRCVSVVLGIQTTKRPGSQSWGMLFTKGLTVVQEEPQLATTFFPTRKWNMSWNENQVFQPSGSPRAVIPRSKCSLAMMLPGDCLECLIFSLEHDLPKLGFRIVTNETWAWLTVRQPLMKKNWWWFRYVSLHISASLLAAKEGAKGQILISHW